MKHWLRATLIVAIMVPVGAVASWQTKCDTPYEISVVITRSGHPQFPYMARGSVGGCGPYALLVGHSKFQMLLRPGRSGRTRTEHGSTAVEVVAGVTDKKKAEGWYIATIERNSNVVASKRAVVPIDR